MRTIPLKPTILDSILALLADGVPRTSAQIGSELQASIDCSQLSVETCLSQRCRDDRRFVRTAEFGHGGGKRYRWTLATDGGRS